jgi:hypothetical protein
MTIATLGASVPAGWPVVVIGAVGLGLVIFGALWARVTARRQAEAEPTPDPSRAGRG